MMTITSKRGSGLNYWGSLVNPDKSPSPLLIQLCLGIAQLMSTLEPSNTEDLTPQKIATFYRAVGGNYDTLFLSMRHSALSLVYQSLGCFHTLQPTNNAFEAPSIPALLPHGFVRWQTIQLLLCPDEHVRFLQEAVKRFDVVNPAGGGTFPKAIPREAFPAAPDPEMVEWHETVSQRLEQDAQTKLNTAAVPPPANRSEGFHNRSSSIDSDNTVGSPDYFSRRAPPSAKGRPGRGSRNAPYEERQTASLPGSRRQSAVPEEPLRPLGRFNDRDSYGFDTTRLRPQPSIEEPPRQRRSKSSTRSDRQARRPVTPGHRSRSRLNAVEVSSDTESDEDSDPGWPQPQAHRTSRVEREMERERQNRRYKHGSDSVSPTRTRNPSRPHSHDATYSEVRRRQQQRERSFSPRHPTEHDDDDVEAEEDDDPDPEEPYTMPMNMNTRPTITRNLHYPHIPPPRPPPTTTPPSSRSSRSASASGSHSSGNSHFQTSRAPNPFKVPFREYIFQDELPTDHDADASPGSNGRGTSKNKSSKSKPKPKPSKSRRESASEMPTTRYHVPKYTTAAPTPTPPPPPPQPQPTQTPSRHHSRKSRNLPHLTTTTLPQTQTQPSSRPNIPARTESDQRPTTGGGGNINIRRVRAQSHTRPPPPPVMNPGYGHDRERSRWSIGGGMGMGGVWD